MSDQTLKKKIMDQYFGKVAEERTGPQKPH